jgi:hypothetical protein
MNLDFKEKRNKTNERKKKRSMWIEVEKSLPSTTDVSRPIVT